MREIRSEDRDRPNQAERNLWASVILQALEGARLGDKADAAWIRSRRGQFARLCGALDLPESRIREKSTVRLNRRKTEQKAA